MFRECYRTATVKESMPLPIFLQLLRESVVAINHGSSMLKHGFDIHRVLLSVPGDLERERVAYLSAIQRGQFRGRPCL